MAGRTGNNQSLTQSGGIAARVAAAGVLFTIAAAVAVVPVAAFAAPDGEGGGGLPQFNPASYPSQIFWLTITFIFLYVFFSLKTIPDIAGVLQRRENHIKSDIDTAEKLQGDAARAQAAYESLMEGSRAESSRLLADASEYARTQAAHELEAFRSRAAEDVAHMEAEIIRAKSVVMDEMHTIVAEVASEAASRIVGIKPDLEQAHNVVQSLKDREAA